MTETQQQLPGIPAPDPTTFWKVTYQYKGPKNKLRNGVLIINAKNAQDARKEAAEQLTAELGPSIWYTLVNCTWAPINPPEKPF